MIRFLFITILVIIASSCDNDEALETASNNQSNSSTSSQCGIDLSNIQSSDLTCDSIYTIDLLAGQTINIGTISIISDGTNLTVTYTTINGWLLDETHVYVGDCGAIPLTPSCDPIFGLFPYKTAHSPGVNSFSYNIDLSTIDSCFCFIAQALVSLDDGNGNIQTETAIGDGPNDFPGNRWGWFSQFCQLPCIDCDIDTGDFRTQTQGGWGSIPFGNNPGTYLYANFDAAFPNNLIVGCTYTITLTSAQAVSNFLPQGGTPVALTSNYIDPTNPILSVLAGNLIAVELALGFDLYDPNFGSSSIYLGDLIITTGAFAGMTLSDLVAIANQALGGCPVSYSLSDINDALSNASQAFVDGNTNTGFLTCP